MAQLTLELPDLYYQQIEKEAIRAGKAKERLILEWIIQLADAETSDDFTKDLLYNFEGFDTEAPDDLSIKTDEYLYAEKVK